MSDNELILVHFHGNDNRNAIIKVLEKHSARHGSFTHKLEDSENSELIAFQTTKNSVDIHKKFCKLRAAEKCTFSTYGLEQSQRNTNWVRNLLRGSTKNVEKMQLQTCLTLVNNQNEISELLQTLIG